MCRRAKKLDFKLDFEEEDGPMNDGHIASLLETEHFDNVYIRSKKRLRAADAKKFALIRSASDITIWCDISRAAIHYFISRPNLESLSIFKLKSPGRLRGFEDAIQLKHFSCMYGLNEADLIEIATLPKIEKLSAQGAQVTEGAIQALLRNKTLQEIDFEGSGFDDGLAKSVSQSTTITGLELGSTKITKAGLACICGMAQLKKLDIWWANIEEADLEMLQRLPNLEYLSIGGHDQQTDFTPEGTFPHLFRMPALKKVWLDGLNVTKAQWRELNERFEEVRVTSVMDH